MKKHKRDLSFHEKRMRFFTVLAVIIVIVLVAALMWLVNQLGQPRY